MKEMSLVEHLEELRTMVVRVVIIVLVAFVLCYSFGDRISEILLMPLREALAGDISGKVVYLGLLDKVLSQLQVAFWSSLILSAPLWFFEVWRFIKPGLYDHEVRAVRPFIVVGFILFCIGVVFGYKLVFPLTFETLLGFGVQNVDATISLKEYLVLSSKVLVFLGMLFQVPNFLLILGFMGVVTKQSLRSMRRYIYVGLSVLSAVLTPPDPMTMMALWVPMVVLFEIGVLAVALIVHPYIERQHTKESKEDE
jgi:sec-independent protein translocase protein TatC